MRLSHLSNQVVFVYPKRTVTSCVTSTCACSCISREWRIILVTMNHKSLHIHEIPVFRNRRKCFFISILEMLLLHRHIYLFSFFYIFEIFSPSLGQHGGGRGRPWSALDGRVVIIIFNDHLDGTDAVVAPLQTFYIVCVMGV